jgi:hypothetical protein
MRAVFRLDLLLWTVHLFFLDDREMFLFHFCVGCNCALSSVVGIFLFFYDVLFIIVRLRRWRHWRKVSRIKIHCPQYIYATSEMDRKYWCRLHTQRSVVDLYRCERSVITVGVMECAPGAIRDGTRWV